MRRNKQTNEDFYLNKGILAQTSWGPLVWLSCKDPQSTKRRDQRKGTALAGECPVGLSRTPYPWFAEIEHCSGYGDLGHCHCCVFTVYLGEGWRVGEHRFLSYNWKTLYMSPNSLISRGREHEVELPLLFRKTATATSICSALARCWVLYCEPL